jgi:hypothetical protein
MAETHPVPKIRFRLPAISDEWKEPSIIVQAAAALLVFFGLLVTAHRIHQSTQATNAQNIYSAEKDIKDVFSAAQKSDDFRYCFVDGTPRTCAREEPRKLFIEMLQHYRLLHIMSEKGAIPSDYVAFRIESFCPYARTPPGRFEIDALASKKRLDPGLLARLTSICKL